MRPTYKLGLFFSSIILSLILLTSCTEEFHECIKTWDECKKACPEELDKEELTACLNACEALHPGAPPEPVTQGPEPNEEYEAAMREYRLAREAYLECQLACAESITIRKNCLEKCDENFRDCLGVEETE